jgi:hypothetical protein
MAVTSIWRVNGWLGKVVLYVENPDKTTNPKFCPSQNDIQGLTDVIAYAMNREKTQVEQADVLQSFVSGVNCLPATAREEMWAVKRRFGKESGTAAYHGYQSFAPGETTPALAHEIGLKLATQLWGERHQVIVATHLDKTNHLHNHFVVNTVSFVDGIKYHRTAKDYREMQAISDALCKEYNLTVIHEPQQGKSQHYGEWRAEREQRPTWRGIVRSDVDEAICTARTEWQFFKQLRQKGYEVKIGKDISLRPPGKERFVRLMRNFGADYSLANIRQRILTQSQPSRPLPELPLKPHRAKLRGNLERAPRATGFRALYLNYCYLLGILPKGNPQRNKRLHFLLKEELLKLDHISEEAKLLARHRIDTAHQLSSYKNTLESKIYTLTDRRKQLYRRQRTISVKQDEAKLTAIKAEITALSKELSNLRQEVKLCDNITKRSGVIPERIKIIRKNTQPIRKEQPQHEQFR